MMKSYFLLLLMLVLPFWGHAEDPPEAERYFQEELTKSEEDDNRFVNEFLNMLFVLGVIVGSLLLISWFLKRMMRTRVQHANVTSSIKIIEHRSISQKTSIYILEVKGKNIVIAESQGGIAQLTEL